MAAILARPNIVEALARERAVPYISTPDQTVALLKADIAKYAKIIKTSNMKIDN